MAPKKAPAPKKGAPVKKAPAAKGATKPAAASTSKKPEEKPAAVAAPPVPDTKRVIKTIPVKQIAKILIEDENEEIRKSKRGVLVIDNDAHIAGRSLQYLGGNVLEAADPSHMDPERLRKALVGAVRFNKPLTLDLADCSRDMVDVLATRFNEIDKDLFEKCLDRRVCTMEAYSAIVRDSDGEEYKVPDYYGDDFEEFVCKKFQFHLLMKNDTYPDDFKNRFDVITVE